MLDLESTIKHCEEMAEKNEEMCRVEELMGLGLQNTEMMKCARTHKQLGEWLKELKKLREQTRWIPTSERLPKAGEYIEDGDVAKYYLVQNEYGDMMVARYTHSEYWEQIYKLKPIEDEIVAWCELPEPYVPEINVGNMEESVVDLGNGVFEKRYKADDGGY